MGKEMEIRAVKGICAVPISPGSGASMVDIAIKKGAQVLITGDIGHHEGIDSVARGMAVIDAGHYGLEHIFMSFMKEYLEKLPGADLQVIMEEKRMPVQVI